MGSGRITQKGFRRRATFSTLVHGSRLGITCSGQRTRASCPLQLELLGKEATHPPTSSLLVSNWSRTKTFVRTLPPASRQILAAATSRRNPLRPRTPATAHADRWWPKTSRRRPHRQTRAVRGSGRRKRRRNNTFKTCGSKRVARLVGKLTNGAGAKRPPWDFKRAISGSDRATQRSRRTTPLHVTRLLATPPWAGSVLHPQGLELPLRSEPWPPNSPGVDSNDAGRLIVSLNSFKDGFCHLWVAFVNHLDSVCPAGPIGDMAQPRRTPQPPDLLLRVATTSLLSNWGMVPLVQLWRWCKNNAKSVHRASARTPQSIQGAQF